MVAASAPVLCVPLIGSDPDHAPEAVHEVALVEDQVTVAPPPAETMLGSDLIVMVGAATLAPAVTEAGCGWVAVLGEVLACVPVPTSEPQPDNPTATANAGSQCRLHIKPRRDKSRHSSINRSSIVLHESGACCSCSYVLRP